MKIAQEQNKPYIYLDEDNCVLTIKGASYPEHASNFYDPIIEHIEKCLPKMESKEITINLAMSLMNSVSEKCIFKMLTIIKEVCELTVNWYYEEDDEDMELEGELWQSLLKSVKFNMFSIEDIDKIVI